MKITQRNNFVRIFKIPHSFPNGFCFGGGHPVNFQLVDWFEPYPACPIPIDIKDVGDDVRSFKPLWDCPNGEIELTPELREKLNTMLRAFIKAKDYSDGSDLLAITNYGDAFIVKAEKV